VADAEIQLRDQQQALDREKATRQDSQQAHADEVWFGCKELLFGKLTWGS
jgi:hypothetical protein